MRPVEVRNAAPAEASAISRLLADVIRVSYIELMGSAAVRRLVAHHCSLTRISAEIGIPGGAPGWLGWMVAAAEDGSVVGAAAGGVPMPGRGELYTLCTAPSRRREGIGSALLSATTGRMLTHSAEQQWVSLPCAQETTLSFFAHHGFKAPDGAAPEGSSTLRWARAL